MEEYPMEGIFVEFFVRTLLVVIFFVRKYTYMLLKKVRGLIFIIITYLFLFLLTIVLKSIFIPVSYEQKLKFILSV